MSEEVWDVVSAIGVAQGCFLVGALLLQRRANRRVARTLALLVATLTLIILGEALARRLDASPALFVVCININTELLIGPLLLLFVRSVLDPDRPVGHHALLWFLPWALGVASWVALASELRDLPGALAEIHALPLTTRFVLFKACFLIAFVVATYRTLAKGLRTRRRFVAGRQEVGVEWLQYWLIGLSVVPAVIYVLDLLERSGFELGGAADRIGSLLLAAMIYLVSLLLLLRPWLLSLTPRPNEPTRWASEAARLTAYLERERPWLEPDLALGDLARAMATTENRLSALLSEGLGTTYYALLTRYRLQEFELLARNPAWRDRSVLDLAFEAGFNSKASFYRAFRRAHGVTPTQFREAEQGPRARTESHPAR